jgi:hypothetical protein
MIWPVEFVAFRQAIAWIAAFMPPDLTMSSMARGIIDHVVFCKAMCAATCRTVHSRHSYENKLRMCQAISCVCQFFSVA